MKFDIHFFTKIGALIAGGFIIGVSIQRFYNMNFSEFQNFILTIHYVWMGAVLILAEFRFKYVYQNFKLITSFCGRENYSQISLGTLMITDNDVFQIAVATILFVIGLGYFILQLFSKKYGWSTAEQKNPYEIPATNNAPQPQQGYQPPYQGSNFKYSEPALK